MSFIFLNRHLSSVIVLIRRSAMNKSNRDLPNQMKSFNQSKQYRKTLELFDKNKTNLDVVHCRSTLFHVLKASTELHDLKYSSNIQQLISTNFNNDPYLSASLIHLYMQCGHVHRSELLFNSLKQKSEGAYGAMMKGYIKNNKSKQAIDLFNQIKNPDDISYTLLMKAYAQLGSKIECNSIEDVLSTLPQSVYSNTYFLTSLIDALSQSGDVTSAQKFFDSAKIKSEEMYATLMKGYIANNQADKAIDIFKQIRYPTDIIYTLLMKAYAQQGSNDGCTSIKDILITLPQSVYSNTYFLTSLIDALPQSVYSNTYFLTSLIDALSQSGDVTSAQKFFDSAKIKSEEMYATLMKGYIANNQADKAIDIFKQIRYPTDIIYTLLMKAYAQQGSKDGCNSIKDILPALPQSIYSNTYFLTSLIDAFGQSGDVISAQKFFDSAKIKSEGMYATLMKGYIANNQADKAIDLFKQMKNPNDITYILLFNAYAHLASKDHVNSIKNISKNIPKSLFDNPRLITSLLNALVKCGDTESAQILFNSSTNKSLELSGALMKGYTVNNQSEKAIEMFKDIDNPNSVIYTLLFNACAQLETNEALNTIKQTLKHMPKSFFSEPILLTALVDAFVKCGDFISAQTLFTKSKIKTIEMFSVMMNGFNREDNPDNVIVLFHQMGSYGVERDTVIYLSLIKALTLISDQSLSQSMFEQIPNDILLDDRIQTALINMWGRCGSVEKARKCFENLSKPDAYGYTSMINAYGLNGMGNQALELYQQMPHNLINEITHICLINACSHAGLVNAAQSMFAKIQTKTEQICVTMVDVLSRASLFEQAQHLIKQYEHDHPPSLVMYMAVLSGARNEKNSRLAQYIYDQMKKLFPQSKDVITSGSTLLANIYAATGDVEKATDLQHQIRQSGVKKKIGLSWTVVNGEIYRFKAHDQSHPRSTEIYAELEKISNELIQHGHEYDSSWIIRPLGQDETVASVLCGHSERLAIAWNFVANRNAPQIQVTKNLRVCGDCHRATKLIAAIRQCDIIVRDANRVHHFYKNGQCSCNDYF